MSEMSRQMKRKHWAENKRNPDALFCPKCKHKTIHIAMPNEDTCDIYCTVCYNRLVQGVKPGTNGVAPRDKVKGRMWKVPYSSQK